MAIEQIIQAVQAEFGMSGLSEGVYGDFAREVSKRAVIAEREELMAAIKGKAEEWDDRAEAYGMLLAADVVAEHST